MMLRYSFGMAAEADCIETAVGKVLDKGLRTADNMSEGCTCLGCAAMGDAILAEMIEFFPGGRKENCTLSPGP